MRIMLLGAKGFLGRHICQSLSSAGYTVLVAPPHAGLDLVTQHEKFAEMIQLARPAAVVNAAGATSGTSQSLLAANVAAVGSIIAGCRLSLPRVRLVHIGSAAEYGPGQAGVPVSEDAQPDPVSVYGRSKLFATQQVLHATKAGDVDGVVLRVFNPLGWGQPANSLPGRVAAELASAETDAPIQLGPLDAARDYVDARDVASAVVAAIADPFATGLTFNVAGGQAVPVRDLVEGLVVRSGHRGPVLEDGDGSVRSAAVDWQQADIGLAERVLRWRPRHTLDESLDAVWEGACGA